MGFCRDLHRVVIGRRRSMKYMELCRIPRARQFIDSMASGMKDCITVIHRLPSVSGGQVSICDWLLVQLLCHHDNHDLSSLSSLATYFYQHCCYGCVFFVEISSLHIFLN